MSSNPLVKPNLITRSLHPENQETPISFIHSESLSNKLFFRRNHFAYPLFTSYPYWLPISGLVPTPKIFSLQDIQKLPSKTLKLVLECAGNKRALLEPKTFGEQWEKGAISQGIWKGVPLRTLLELTGVSDDATEVVIEGYDYGERKDLDSIHTFARSLPLKKAFHPDTLIAYEYNHQPIPFKHGFPLRLIVPQWYAMASVKWISQIRLVKEKFEGPFQSIDYVYYPNKENNKDSTPVTTIQVNSTIQKPLDMDTLNTGMHKIKGIAWTGQGHITKIEVSVDNGNTWEEAMVTTETKQWSGYQWCPWTFDWFASKKGEYTILSKATDSTGRTQPKKPSWNRKGYGYNAIDQIKIKIE
jgi:DMSO/TMAO reductase YedYZ molybdopterin-dependent catalytic subunit